ncbi:Hypothetical protein SMAX5B_011589 [Scophthalmus maximus]|uniref:Uncharacterized protein n=1 Tax=Scophthalmus maximus TaxID=52904 RepID=A0A2U9BPC1_SCOMX|nr:Hypothetical protein SMAX5B_011589 [Scophthalmus maximus]
MFCALWVLFQTLAVVVQGGVSSGSDEALANGAVNNNGGAVAGSNANSGAHRGVPPNSEPLVARLVQLGGSFFIQPVGNQIGQAPLQQLIPIGALQQGGAFPVVQTGGANVNPQGQVAQTAGGGPVTLLAVLSQRNAGGNPGGQHGALLTPGQVQLISTAGLNNQPQPGAAGGNAAGRVRFQRSVAARLRGTQSPVTKTQRMLAAMNAGLVPGVNGALVPGMNAGLAYGANPRLMAGGLNLPMVAGGGAGFIGQPQFPQFVPGLPAFALPAPVPNVYPFPAVNTLPFMGVPQMAQMNPAQQPPMGVTGGAVAQQFPLQADPLRRFRRQIMKQGNNMKTTVDTQVQIGILASNSNEILRLNGLTLAALGQTQGSSVFPQFVLQQQQQPEVLFTPQVLNFNPQVAGPFGPQGPQLLLPNQGNQLTPMLFPNGQQELLGPAQDPNAPNGPQQAQNPVQMFPHFQYPAYGFPQFPRQQGFQYFVPSYGYPQQRNAVVLQPNNGQQNLDRTTQRPQLPLQASQPKVPTERTRPLGTQRESTTIPPDPRGDAPGPGIDEGHSNFPFLFEP